MYLEVQCKVLTDEDYSRNDMRESMSSLSMIKIKNKKYLFIE